MSRPSFHSAFMSLALNLAERSTCRRLKVGSVITSLDHRKVFSIGYNGNASGLKNDCDSDEPGKCGCLHAEENAVINCDISRDTKKLVYCTHLPCLMCAKRLINLGSVHAVIFQSPYRAVESVNAFLETGIRIDRFLAAKDSADQHEHLFIIKDVGDRYSLGLPDRDEKPAP